MIQIHKANMSAHITKELFVAYFETLYCSFVVLFAHLVLQPRLSIDNIKRGAASFYRSFKSHQDNFMVLVTLQKRDTTRIFLFHLVH